MENQPVLFSTACFPPVSYFSELVSATEFAIEVHENFIKQTYRNRYVILGANGPINLIVPVEKGRGRKKPIRDIRIYNQLDWQRNHWRTIFSAYNSSPFFEFYKDDIKPFFKKRWEFLFDFNQAILETFFEILEFKGEIKTSASFEKKPEGVRDLRNSISPKIEPQRNFTEYTQVFSEKFGFTPNLSILDLVFNKGPESLSVLAASEPNSPGN